MLKQIKHYCFLVLAYMILTLLIGIGLIMLMSFVFWLFGISFFGNIILEL